MSLFGSLMGDMDDDPYFGGHMNQMMRQMNTMMNSFFADPFALGAAAAIGGPTPDFDRSRGLHSALMPFTMPMMPNFNRLLSGSLDSLGGAVGIGGGGGGGGGHSYSSSTVVSMSSGPDGRPQVYKATSSTRTAPGGIKETQRTESDSRSGTKKMAIGHHIGERAHIIEKEQNVRTGDQEERQDFINLDEDDAEDFNREWETKTRSRSDLPRIGGGMGALGGGRSRHGYGGAAPGLLAITGAPSRRRHRPSVTATTTTGAPLVTPRRSLHTSPISVMSASGSRTAPYTAPGQVPPQRKSKNLKTVNGSPSHHQHQHHHHHAN